MLTLIQNHLLKRALMLESKLILKSLKENRPKTKMNCGKNIFSSYRSVLLLSFKRADGMKMADSINQRGKGADLTPPQITSLASPHRPKASDGSLEPRRHPWVFISFNSYGLLC